MELDDLISELTGSDSAADTIAAYLGDDYDDQVNFAIRLRKILREGLDRKPSKDRHKLPTTIFYLSEESEFKSRGVTEPGWYWNTFSFDPDGPFDTRFEAVQSLFTDLIEYG